MAPVVNKGFSNSLTYNNNFGLGTDPASSHLLLLLSFFGELPVQVRVVNLHAT